MKNILLTLLLLFALTAAAQDKKSLETQAADLLMLTKTNQYEKLLDYTHPGIFQYATKEQMLEAMRTMMKGPNYTVKIKDVAPNFKFSEIFTIAGASYARVNYDMITEMTFEKPLPPQKKEEMINILKSSMDTENVTIDTATRTATIGKNIEMVAVFSTATNGHWVFVNNDGGILIKSLVPQEALTGIGAKM